MPVLVFELEQYFLKDEILLKRTNVHCTKKRSQKYHKAFASRANACAWCQTRGAYYSSQSLLSNQPRPETSQLPDCLRKIDGLQACQAAGSSSQTSS
jgi:hypothetical protein